MGSTGSEGENTRARAWEAMARVGRIARAHGNRGQVIVDPDTDFLEERYKPGSVVYMRREDRDGKPGGIEPLKITAARFQRGRPILALEGVETMNAAEELAGAELRIDADALQPLPPGSFYQHDLIGCAVETFEGMAIGSVTKVDGSGAGSRLVVQGRSGSEILIPLAEEIVVGVHLAARKIVVQPPDGLLDLNVTRQAKI
ncbi:MAG TPA: ribosome maturation factor RimM [Vicinamibacterales bacterium]|nr:ribosome maturation factor RimM [Vicinamibacterales bacterium]